MGEAAAAPESEWWHKVVGFLAALWVLGIVNGWNGTSEATFGDRLWWPLYEEPEPMVQPSPRFGVTTPAPYTYDPTLAGYPSVPYDLDCADVGGPILVTPSDPYRLDGDGDGIGCE